MKTSRHVAWTLPVHEKSAFSLTEYSQARAVLPCRRPLNGVIAFTGASRRQTTEMQNACISFEMQAL
jgi:hypothetical protein